MSGINDFISFWSSTSFCLHGEVLKRSRQKIWIFRDQVVPVRQGGRERPNDEKRGRIWPLKFFFFLMGSLVLVDEERKMIWKVKRITGESSGLIESDRKIALRHVKLFFFPFLGGLASDFSTKTILFGEGSDLTVSSSSSLIKLTDF